MEPENSTKTNFNQTVLSKADSELVRLLDAECAGVRRGVEIGLREAMAATIRLIAERNKNTKLEGHNADV